MSETFLEKFCKEYESGLKKHIELKAIQSITGASYNIDTVGNISTLSTIGGSELYKINSKLLTQEEAELSLLYGFVRKVFLENPINRE